MDAAGQAGVVGAHELLDLQAHDVLFGAFGHELLGEHPATILMPEGSLTVPRVAE